MKSQTEKGCISRRKSLPVSLAMVLAGAISAAQAGDAPIAGDRTALRKTGLFLEVSLHASAAEARSKGRSGVNKGNSAVPRAVMNCDDDGSPGTLRSQVTNAVDGDTIDLSQLMCSTITLGSAIEVNQDNLTLKGPGAAYLTLDGAAHSPIIEHSGFGTLTVYDLTIANGYRVGDLYSGGGGCIYSRASVALFRTTVSHCLLGNVGQGLAKGGGVYAHRNLSLADVTIDECHALGVGIFAQGGGAYAGLDLEVKYSTISNNSAYGSLGIGGGLYDHFGNVSIEGSTISGNRANFDAGMNLASQMNTTAQITNSTISGNFAKENRGGINTSMPLTLTNSTVAFNRSHNASNGAGLYSNESLTLESSIIAANVAGSIQSDLGGNGISVTGDHNLITSSSVSVPFDTIHDCPNLDPLANNGGATRTHALRHASAAIDNGSNQAALVHDQRFAPRVAGAAADIGAFERQSTDADERVFVNGFDGLCDR